MKPVSRLRLEGHPDQPEWLSHVNASVLKVKLAMAIIGILDPPAEDLHRHQRVEGTAAVQTGTMGSGSVFGVDQFHNAGVDTCTTMTQEGVLWQTIIHCVFILSAIGIAWTDKLIQRPQQVARQGTTTGSPPATT